MDPDIKITNPLEHSCWNALVLPNSTCSFFHSANWARTLSESYGYTPHYITILHDDKLSALMPFMGIDSMLTGKRAVSLPFTDCCDPIYQNDAQFILLMDYLIACGKERGWKTMEFRTDAILPAMCPPSSTFYGHVLKLSRDEENIFSGFKESTRRNIKKARKEGVEIAISDSPDAIRKFYHLNCMTRRYHGIPPQPYRFFEKLYEHVISKGLGITVLAFSGGRTIAGAVYVHFGKRAIYKYGASDRRYQHLRANNSVMWEAIKWYCGKEYESLHFGRTELENTGLQRFKSGWGAREHKINYYKYNLKHKIFITDPLSVAGPYNAVVRGMPLPLLKLAGSVLYRHVG